MDREITSKPVRPGGDGRFPGRAASHRPGPQTSGDTTPYKVTPVILHGVVSPDSGHPAWGCIPRKPSFPSPHAYPRVVYFDGEEVPREGMDALLEEQLRTGPSGLSRETHILALPPQTSYPKPHPPNHENPKHTVKTQSINRKPQPIRGCARATPEALKSIAWRQVDF